MARKCFYSFHYKQDYWRVGTIKGIGAIEGQPVVSSNEWEAVKRGGDAAIKKWIDDNMKGRTCLIVLAGSATAGRRWVNYEIEQAWRQNMGLLAIHIHNLLDKAGNASPKGGDPFIGFNVGNTPLSSYAKAYDPPFTDSKRVYAHIADNIENWIEAAIKLRGSA